MTVSTIAQLLAYTEKVEQCLSIFEVQGTSVQLATEITNAKTLGQQFLAALSREQKRRGTTADTARGIDAEERERALKACIRVCALPRIARDIGPVAGVIYATLLQRSSEPWCSLWHYTKFDEEKDDVCMTVPEFIAAHKLYLPLCRGLLVVNSSAMLQMPLPAQAQIKLDCLGTMVEPATLMELIFYLAVGMSNQPEIQYRFVAFDTLTIWFNKLDRPLDPPKRQWLISLIWDSWRDPTDAVQHKVKLAFEGLLKHLAAFPMEEEAAQQQIEQFKDDLMAHLLMADWREEMKYGFLGCLVPYVSMARFVDEKLLASLMMAMSDVVVGSHAMALIVTIMEHLTIHDPASEYWSAVWIPFVARGLLASDEIVRKYMGRVVGKLFKFNPSTFAPLYARITEDSSNSSSSGSDGELQDLKHIGQLALVHPDEQVRVDLLALVCEARRTTDPVTAEELSLVRQFLRVNMHVAQAHFRQQTTAAMARLMKRLHDNAAACTHDRPERPAEMYRPGQQFVAWLIRHCLQGFYPNAPFTRVAMSLRLLHQLLEYFLLSSSPDAAYHCHNCQIIGRIIEEQLFQPEATQSLVALLLDSYDANRWIAHQCLAYFPAPLPGYDTAEKVQRQLLAGGWSSLADPKASQSDGGASIVLLVFQKYIARLGWYIAPPGMEASASAKEDPKVYFMTRLLEDIEGKIAEAKRDLSLAARRHPVHGALKAFSYLYRDVIEQHALQAATADVHWSRMNDQLLSVIEQVIDIVVTALEHPAPEGYEQDDEELLVLRSQDHHFLLTYCWRGIKEASALLEHIVRGGVQSIKQQAERTFPSVDLIIECGDRLRRLLVGLRHRGAFSHIYSHFEAVCQLLHQSPEPRLSAMIPQWLESMFDQMQSASISITRRSGGIPYGILALVMCDPPGQLLHTATSRLFDMTADIMAGDLRANTEDKAKKQEDDERIIAQVHAMNTLRMLLTDA
ncbi:putative death-receptor fusion protein-domain-containing protein, partial [Syncephalis pseudoplumigaleata]